MLQNNSRQFQKSEPSNIASYMILIVRFNRVKSLSDVLRDTGKRLPKRELTRQQETELNGISERCCNILEELDKNTGQVSGIGFPHQLLWREVSKSMEETHMGPEVLRRQALIT